VLALHFDASRHLKLDGATIRSSYRGIKFTTLHSTILGVR